MKILVVTHDYDRFKKIKDEADGEVLGCFRTYHFKKMAREHKPDIILSDGKCKKIDRHGQSVPCLFSPEEKLKRTSVQAPVFPIIGWKLWVKIVEFYNRVVPFSN